MRAEQREAVLVLADRFHRNRPTQDGVTLVALRAHLAPVNVGVAIGALFPDVSKYRLDMALGAGDTFVHAAQRVTRAVVIELGNVADRLPSAEGVAVLARDGQRAVRAARGRGGLLRRQAATKACKQQHDDLNSEQ